MPENTHMLLTADLHLTDRPEDEYRWAIFKHLRKHALEQGVQRVGLLGDIADRKDRHSAALVNRMVHELTELTEGDGPEVLAIMGNHDHPLRGDPFWGFLSRLDIAVQFFYEPTWIGSELWLPYTHDPGQWDEAWFRDAEVIFMHQPVSGARVEHGRKLEFDDGLPRFPKGLPIYAGDIHVHQKVRGVQYIGAPHWIKFGDQYPCRLLRIDADYQQIGEIALHPPLKTVVHLKAGAELPLDLKAGDQIKIEVDLTPGDLDKWGGMQERLMAEAAKIGLRVASIEGVMVANDKGGGPKGGLAEMDSMDALEEFCRREAMAPEYIDQGRVLLRAAIAGKEAANP